jgi:hypothetical protein
MVCRVNLSLLSAGAQPVDAIAAGADSLLLRVRLLLSPLLLLLLPGAMAAIEAAGGGSQQTVMAGIVSGNAADHGALQAAFGLGAIGRNDECDGDEQ